MENRKDLKIQIKAHLAKAEGYQTQIEDLSAKTIGERKKVIELNEKLEFNEKIGATHASVDIQSSLDNELDKLKKIKELFDKVSQENWSNRDYFSSFFQFASELKAAYLEKTTPKIDHLKSLIDELEIGQ